MEELKKAEEMCSLNELGLSGRTKSYLLKKFNYDIQAIILYGRNTAAWLASYPGSTCYLKSALELARALELAGYVRDDITLKSFAINRAKAWLNGEVHNPALFPVTVTDLSVVRYKHGLETVDVMVGNKRYEEYVNPTEEEFGKVRELFRAILKPEWYEVVLYRMGLSEDSQHPYSLDETAYIVSKDREYVKKMEVRTLKYFRLRSIHAPSGNPVTESSDIDDLMLGVGTYTALRRAGINTVGDVLRFPKEEWKQMRCATKKRFEEIETAMRRNGYPEFSICTPAAALS